jgi:hypothetical protein
MDTHPPRHSRPHSPGAIEMTEQIAARAEAGGCAKDNGHDQ